MQTMNTCIYHPPTNKTEERSVFTDEIKNPFTDTSGLGRPGPMRGEESEPKENVWCHMLAEIQTC